MTIKRVKDWSKELGIYPDRLLRKLIAVQNIYPHKKILYKYDNNNCKSPYIVDLEQLGSEIDGLKCLLNINEKHEESFGIIEDRLRKIEEVLGIESRCKN